MVTPAVVRALKSTGGGGPGNGTGPTKDYMLFSASAHKERLTKSRDPPVGGEGPLRPPRLKAACRLAHRRQPQRHHAAGPARRRDPAGARPPRPPTPPTAQALRRQGLPLARGPHRTAPPPHPGEDCLG